MGDTREHQQRLARAQRTLLSNLWHPQKHRICLRRSKYMVVRMASRALHWSTVKEDKDSSVVWLDRWESGDLMNLAPPRKVSSTPGGVSLLYTCASLFSWFNWRAVLFILFSCRIHFFKLFLLILPPTHTNHHPLFLLNSSASTPPRWVTSLVWQSWAPSAA